MPRKSANQRTPPAVLEKAAAALRVLAHRQRLQIAELLLESDHSVGDLAAALGMAQNACSQHLNLMRANGLLASERDGRVVYYRVADPIVETVIHCIQHHATPRSRGRSRLATGALHKET
jgi:DNA-binding transcriptional ArsR family regulator